MAQNYPPGIRRLCKASLASLRVLVAISSLDSRSDNQTQIPPSFLCCKSRRFQREPNFSTPPPPKKNLWSHEEETFFPRRNFSPSSSSSSSLQIRERGERGEKEMISPLITFSFKGSGDEGRTSKERVCFFSLCKS